MDEINIISNDDARISFPKTYEIDFEKVRTLDDVINILKKLNIKIWGDEHIKGIEHLLKEC